MIATNYRKLTLLSGIITGALALLFILHAIGFQTNEVTGMNQQSTGLVPKILNTMIRSSAF